MKGKPIARQRLMRTAKSRIKYILVMAGCLGLLPARLVRAVIWLVGLQHD